MTMRGKVLVWLSFNRSGTNYLTDLLAALPSVTSMTEVFERSAVQVHSFQEPALAIEKRLMSLAKFFEIPVSELDTSHINRLMQTPRLVQAVHANPIQTIHHLSDFNETPFSSLKIFPHHLPLAALQKVISDERVIPCIFLRNPTDVFISMEKRKISKAFRGIDTTSINPRLGYKKYAIFLEKRAQFIKFLHENEEKFGIKLSYESLMRLKSDSQRIEYLARRLKGFGSICDDRCPISPSPIQDRNLKWDDKISNFRNFSKRCAQNGIALGSDLEHWGELDKI